VSYITKEGNWAPEGHTELIPVSRPDSDFRPSGVPGFWYSNPFTNAELWQNEVAQAAEPSNMWEMVKFAGSIYQRAIETAPLPIAEWPAIGRGAMMPVAQHPSVVSGNVYNQATLDRYGPFRDPRQTQSALDAFNAWAMPRQVSSLEASTVYSGQSALGFGAPGG
jgi:hypothetical protein